MCGEREQAPGEKYNFMGASPDSYSVRSTALIANAYNHKHAIASDFA
jgi:hypothetical protein